MSPQMIPCYFPSGLFGSFDAALYGAEAGTLTCVPVATALAAGFGAAAGFSAALVDCAKARPAQRLMATVHFILALMNDSSSCMAQNWLP